jgi:hypothetical protein
VLGFIGETPKAIYIRDFNLDDPEIEAHIVDDRDPPYFLGCWFDVARSPHCAWHMFGQSPPESLKRQIMERPYRLYPPLIGKERSR